MSDTTSGRFVAQARLELMAGEDADAIIEAVMATNPDATVEVLPGQVNISAPGRLGIRVRRRERRPGPPLEHP